MSFIKKNKELVCIMKVIGEEKDYAGAINTIEDNAKFSHVYEVEILYMFKNSITLTELKKYSHHNGKNFQPSPNISYINNYPKLIEDIIKEKFS